METVIIKTCVRKDTQKGTFWTIELSDGRKGISKEDLSKKMGMQVELDVKEGKEYQGEMQYYFNLPNSDKPAGKFPAKDWAFNKRESSLKCAIDSIKLTNQAVSSENIIALAEKYFTYLNQK